MTTISQLLKDKNTERQYDILMKADRIFYVGSYYGGPLDEFEVAYLLEEPEKRKRTGESSNG